MSTLSSFPDSPEQDEILRETHVWSDIDPLELSIMNVLTAIEEASQEDLPPLYPTVDVEALKQVLLDAKDEPRENVTVTYDFEGFLLKIDSQGSITAVLTASPN